MNHIQQIARSREVLRKQLGGRNYNVENLPKISEVEIKKKFEVNKGEDQSASLCNFSLSHNDHEEWKIHVIYFNFPPSNPTISSKVLKNAITECGEKNNVEDNVIIIVPSDITTAHETYIGWMDIISMGLSKPTGDDTLSSKITSDPQFSLRHLSNIQIFNIDAVCINILEHEMVPQHTLITNNQDIKDIMENYYITSKTQFPVIQKHDPVAEIIGAVAGDVIEIERVSASGSSIFYRFCK